MSSQSEKPRIDFYYGIASRYSYLASTQIVALESECGCVVDWRPLSSRALIPMSGFDPFRETGSSGQYDWTYRQADAEAWADYYGVSFKEPPDALKFDDALIQRLALACAAAARLGRAAAFSRTLFAVIFADGSVPSDIATLTGHARRAGLDAGAFESALSDPATQTALAATAAEAHARGAFGVPTFFLGDRMFWGNDRLVLLRHALAKTV